MEKINTSGKLIRKTLISVFPGSFLYALMFCFIYMVDAILAGNLVGTEGLAAVAIGLPAYGMLLSTQSAICHGTTLRVTWAKGRGNNEAFQRAFRGGLTLAGIYGLFLMGVLLFLGKQLAMIFGGGKSTSNVLAYAILYIRFCAPMMLLSALGDTIREALGVMGYQGNRAFLGVANMVANLVGSIVVVNLLPAELKMAGLGIGSSIGALTEFLLAIIFFKIHKVKSSFKPLLLNFHEIGETLRSGLPSSLDTIIDCAIAAFVNNLILAGFPEDPLILSIVSVVNNVKKIIRIASSGAGYAVAPLFGIFYAVRDRASLKRTMAEGLKFGMIVTILWCTLCYSLFPILCKLYGMEQTPELRFALLLVALLTPAYQLVYLFTSFYESTERFVESLLMAAVPDSLVYPLMLVVLIPLLGRKGIWVSIAGNPLVGFILLIPVMLILSHKTPGFTDKLLRMQPWLLKRNPEFDYEITQTEESAVGLAAKIQAFLGGTSRTAFVAALCTEELAVDMMLSAQKNKTFSSSLGNKILDVKLFDDGDEVEIIIRSAGKPYNPLDFTFDKEDLSKIGVVMAQKMAKQINYNYVYKINSISILLEKTH